VRDELEAIWKEKIVGLLEVIQRRLPQGTVENNDIPH
jgi:hypothetical protein